MAAFFATVFAFLEVQFEGLETISPRTPAVLDIA
jgi:hypothetical protein